MNKIISDKAEQYEKIIEEKLVGEKGVIYAFVHEDDLRPISAETFKGQGWQYWNRPDLNLPPPEEWLLYEDSLAIDGFYLSAMSRKAIITGSKEDLKKAERIFKTACWHYEIGKEKEKGYIPKPYGLKCTDQWSMDNQCPYIMGLYRYYDCCVYADREKITEIITAMADYWIKYKHHSPQSYFREGTIDFESEQYYPGHWPLAYLTLYKLAWNLTGDMKYADEFERLALEKLNADTTVEEMKKIGCIHRWPIELCNLMEIAPEKQYLWLPLLEKWKKVWIETVYEKKTDSTKIPPSIYGLIFGYWTEDEEMIRETLKRMEETELKDFIYKQHPDDFDWEEEYEWWYKVIATGNLSMWQEAYWLGRGYRIIK